MKLMNLIARFRKDEDGAVTVDWVVLTAGVVAVAIAVGAFLQCSLTDLADTIEEQINDNSPFDTDD